jgi:hypothetical protein
MFFKHHDINAHTRQQKAQHHTGRAAPSYATARFDRPVHIDHCPKAGRVF